MDIKDPTSLQEIVNQTTLGYWNTAIGRIHDSNNILGTGTTWKRFLPQCKMMKLPYMLLDFR